MLSNIQKICQDLHSRPFPAGCAISEVDGVRLAELDSLTAGCIDTFVAHNGQLDGERISILRKCAERIGVIVPVLEGEALDYFEQLQMVSHEVLRAMARNGGGQR